MQKVDARGRGMHVSGKPPLYTPSANPPFHSPSTRPCAP